MISSLFTIPIREDMDIDAFILKSESCIQQSIIRPVSYTHLDVYKRQIVISLLISKKENPTLKDYIFAVTVGAIIMVEMCIRDRIYTNHTK